MEWSSASRTAALGELKERLSLGTLRRAAVQELKKPQLRRYVSPSATACAEKGGYVVVQLQIDKNGSTSDVKAVVSPSASLGESAVAAVQSWTFSPALLDKKPKPSGGRIALACEGPGFSVAEADRSDSAVRTGKGFSQPQLVFKVEPEYSEEARKGKHQGEIILMVVIDQMGRPISSRVIRSLGYGLDEKAAEAVVQWRFKPGMDGDKPVTMAATVELHFRLL
jgi:TonB family protein